MTTEETARLGREAEQALAVLNAACDSVTATLQKTLASLPMGSPDQVLTTHAALVTVQQVRTALAGIVGNGQLAEAALQSAKLIKGGQ